MSRSDPGGNAGLTFIVDETQTIGPGNGAEIRAMLEGAARVAWVIRTVTQRPPAALA